MASVSQNFPRTYYNLSKTWDAKVGSMAFEQATFMQNYKTNKDQVAALLHAAFKNNKDDIVNTFCNFGMDGVSMYDNSIWIYNMRASDTLPKAPADLSRLYQFVRIAVTKWFGRKDQMFLEQNIHITVCFFLWYITKPHFFFKDKVTRQTTRFGIERIWTPLLLAKKIVNTQPTLTKAAKSKQQVTNALLPKQQKDQENLRKQIERLVGCTFEWDDSHCLHLNMSKYLSGNELNINQQKKLQKTYHEYTALTEKVNRTLAKIRRADLANSKIAKRVAAPNPVEDQKSVEEETWEEGEFVGKSAEEGVPDNWDDEEVPDNWDDDC